MISVVIPTFNRQVPLTRALNSVLEQTRAPDEIIVVDNGSTDATMCMLKEDYPSVIALNEIKVGVSAARNKGIVSAKGDWIAFLDSDDAWRPSKLEKQEIAFKQNKLTRFVHTNEVWFRDGQFVNQMKKHKKGGGEIFENCLAACCISPSSVLMEKKLFDEVGKFDEDLPACEDYDMWLRISAQEPVMYLNECLTIKYGGHGDQLSKKYWGMDRFRIKSLEKLLFDKKISKVQKKATHKMLIKKLKILLAGAAKRKNQELINIYMPKLLRWE